MAKPARVPARRGAGADIVAEPDWKRLLPNVAERNAAKRHWRQITEEMKSLDTLSPANGHALQRLVIAYLVYDRCSIEVAGGSLVTEANKENSKSIDRLSIHYRAMREAEKTAERLEAQLGLSPGRRGRVGKVQKKRERSAGADAFLGSRQA